MIRSISESAVLRNNVPQRLHAIVVIPARIASSRLPRKVLADIAGKPMIQHVWEQACQARTVERVVVATDGEEVMRAVQSWGGEAVLTDPSLPSGTARIASIMEQINSEVIVNVQGDQPFVEPDLIDALVQGFHRVTADVVTPVWRINDVADLVDPGIAKVVRGHDGRALYFSRSPIPYVRDAELSQWLHMTAFWGHYGIYGFQRHVLENYSLIPPGILEQAERLEQLCFLEAGYVIHTVETPYRQVAIDTPEDLERIRRIAETFS